MFFGNYTQTLYDRDMKLTLNTKLTLKNKLCFTTQTHVNTKGHKKVKSGQKGQFFITGKMYFSFFISYIYKKNNNKTNFLVKKMDINIFYHVF